MIHTKTLFLRIYTLFICLLATLSVSAQQEAESGSYVMPYHVSNMTLSTDSSYICITFTQTGRTARYGIFDLESRTLSWMSEEMDTERGKVSPTRYGLMVMRDWGLLWNISLIDPQRGVATWSEPGVGGFRYDERTDMALAVKKNVKEPGLILKGFNVSSGDTLWRYRINHEFVQGMNGGMYAVSDTVALVVADQLCLVSRGAGNIDYCAYDEPVQGGDMPVLVRGGRIYVSDRRHVTCYNRWLRAQWTAAHPATGRCRLQRVGKRLYLINEGYVRKMLEADDRGVAPIVKEQVCKPFIACYDSESGSKVSQAMLNWKRSDGALERIYVNAVFYAKDDDGQVFKKVQTPADGCFVKVDDGTIYVLNEKMKVKEKYTDDKVFHRYFQTSRCVGIASANEACITSPDGLLLRRLPQGTTAICRVGNEVFYTIGDAIYWESLP